MLQRSTALTALDPRCKPCARPAIRKIIRRFGWVVDRIICGFYSTDFISALTLKEADSTRTSRHVGLVPIVQKSFGSDERNFLGPLMRFVRRDVRDLIAHQKNGRGASYRRHRVLQRRSRPKFGFREIFGVVRFSTFATLSARIGHAAPSAPRDPQMAVS